MIKYGALKLKRNKINLFLKYFTLICGISFITFAGCKTVPHVSQNPVKTVDILDDEAAMYVHIPAPENKELLEVFVSLYFKNLSQSDARLIVSKLDDVYISFGSKWDKKRIQLALEGNLPSGVFSILRKNGFKENSYSAASLNETKNNSILNYKYYASDDIQIAAPSRNQLLISKKVQPMLDVYNCEFEAANGFIKNFEEPYREDWKETDLYKWISDDSSSIHFYIVRPQSFLSNLIGSDFSTKVFKLNYAKGNFSKLSNSKYELTLDLDFQNSKYVKPAISILSLTLGLTDSAILTLSPTHIRLSGVHLNVKQLSSMLGL